MLRLQRVENKVKESDMMTQITYQFKKLQFKDERKRL